MKRLLSLLLALAMVLCLLSACADKHQAPAAEEPAPAEAPAEAPAKPAEPAPPPAAEPEGPPPAGLPAEVDSGGFDDSTVAGSSTLTTDTVETESTIVYPIGDGKKDSVSMWYAFGTNAFGQWFDSAADFPCMPYMTEKTGVQLELSEVSDTAATEQYQLMIASGDWCDLIPLGNYTGGASQAFADDVILDLTEYLPENAPDFWARVQTYTPAEQYAGTTDGKYLFLPSINKNTVNDQGFYTRADWLEELGLKVPERQDELMDAIYAMYNAYHPSHALINIDKGCAFGLANSWFDVGIYTVQGSSIATYLKDGKVESGLNQDNYRAYLQWLAGLYKDGLIYQDFYSETQTPPVTNGYIASGDACFWGDMADHMYDVLGFVDNPDFRIQILPLPVNNEGFLYQSPRMPMSTAAGGPGGGAPAVTTSCDQVEFVVQWLNWFYTEEGYQFANYGTPEECWNIDEDGKIQYTDAILHNPKGFNSQVAFTLCGWSITGSVSYGDRFMDTYDESIRNAIVMWSDTGFVRYDQTIPTGAALDADESNSIVSILSDITAYADEAILKWVIGDAVLDDAAWSEYCQRLESLGLSEAVGVYQKAYEDYCIEFGE